MRNLVIATGIFQRGMALPLGLCAQLPHAPLCQACRRLRQYLLSYWRRLAYRLVAVSNDNAVRSRALEAPASPIFLLIVMPHNLPPLILASTSPYRRELLARLHYPFTCVAPEVDETPLPNEAPAALAQRLALAKTQAVARLHPHAVVLGSDQVADLHGQPLGKPHTHERARQQLQRQRGQTVLFHTAIAVARQDTDFAAMDVAVIRTHFRTADEGMSDAAIEAYLQTEQPYDCAGSIKSEGLGIALLAGIENDDPTGLIGLPLMRTCTLLRAAGLDVLSAVAAACQS